VLRLQPDDRRDLAQLALTLLVFGLVVAPWLHLGVTHGGLALPHATRALAHHSSHAPSVPLDPPPAGEEAPGHSHSLGGTEHLQALAELSCPARLERPAWQVEPAHRPAYASATADRWALQPQLPQGP